MRGTGLLIALFLLTGLITLTTTTVMADNLPREGLDNINLEFFNIKGTEMFSLREIADLYNLSLAYNSDEKLVFVANRDNRVKIDLNQGSIGEEELENKPVIIEGRTYLPLNGVRLVTNQLLDEERPDLLTTLSTERKGDKLTARIRAYNITSEPLTLNFSSGQSYDLWLKTNGEEVWRWSDGKFFTMAIISRELKPGEKLDYIVDLPTADLKPGSYLLSGELTTVNPIPLGEVDVIIHE